MICPKCKNKDTKVIDSRTIDCCIRRRRECEKCSYRFTTYETPEPLNLVVVKKDGSLEKFDRNKIIKSIGKACSKRPVNKEQIQKLTYQIEHILFKKYSHQIPSKAIGKLILKKLFSLDKVAYIRFASVYKNFRSINTFSKEIKKINKQ